MFKQFGGRITRHLKQQYSQSPNWREGKFMNLEETTMNVNLRTLPKILYKQFFEKNGREPEQPIPVMPFDKAAFLAPSDKAKFIWYGHSALLIRLNGKTILIDPMLGSDTAPIAPTATRRFSENTLELIKEFPEIDLLLLTHDHYDHLDLASFKLLMPKVKQYFVALGAARHLVSWGINASKIKEFDWWNNTEFEGIEITFTPTRHFSGRGLTDRAKSLWGGWALKTANESIYFSGDSGYGEHFKAVGEKLGPFDFGIMECGQYNENWHQIHMYPEESVQAATDAKVTKAMAVHWAGFALAQHHWKEPIERFTLAAKAAQLPLILPKIGEQFSVSDDKQAHWWETLK